MNFIDADGSTAVLDRGPALRAIGPEDGLIGSFLEDQWDLSAVERFAQFHEGADEPLQGRYYASLMPAEAPGPGQQYAFEVDLDRCSGCKACVAACHNLNGLDEGESWREVGLVIGGRPEVPVLQHVTSSCHHCLEPACLDACPVDAYEKDPVTGIVRHLDDQCFGCRYCTLACPYDAPKFHAGKGIVRKCDMCGDRLAVGEAPACVQACPHEAIVIRIVDRSSVAARARDGDFLPGAPGPEFTRPTTSYRSNHLREPSDVRPADDHRVEPEHPHWPLIAMLVLTQASVGGFAAELAAVAAGGTLGIGMTALSLVLGYAGLAASLLHLGRPLYAYRALIGLRHSWLSREVLAFGIFAISATALVGLELLGPGWLPVSSGMRAALLAGVVAAGAAGVACSVMVYHAVRRESWRAGYGVVKFGGSSAVLGLATATAATGLTGTGGPVALGLIAATALKLAYEARLARGFALSRSSALRKSAILRAGRLRRPAALRVLLGLAGGIVLPTLVIAATSAGSGATTAALAVLALAGSIGGEMAERYLFFAGVIRPKMPGGPLS